MFFDAERRWLSNEQIISPSFGDKDFESRLGIFWGNSPAIVEKNNDVLAQKIIGEMVELFFTCYLFMTLLCFFYLLEMKT